METSKDRECVDDAQIGLLALSLDETLGLVGITFPSFKVLELVVVQEGEGEGDQGVMEHWRVMRGFRGRLGRGDGEGFIHVPQKEVRHDSKTP